MQYYFKTRNMHLFLILHFNEVLKMQYCHSCLCCIVVNDGSTIRAVKSGIPLCFIMIVHINGRSTMKLALADFVINWISENKKFHLSFEFYNQLETTTGMKIIKIIVLNLPVTAAAAVPSSFTSITAFWIALLIIIG